MQNISEYLLLRFRFTNVFLMMNNEEWQCGGVGADSATKLFGWSLRGTFGLDPAPIQEKSSFTFFKTLSFFSNFLLGLINKKRIICLNC